MSTYRVLIPWTGMDGQHAPGDEVTLTPHTPAEQVEVERLVAYGVIEAVRKSD